GFLLFPGHGHEYRTAERRWDIWWFHCTGRLISLLGERSGRAYIPPTPFDDPSDVLDPMRTIVREFQEKTLLFDVISNAYARVVLVELMRKAQLGAADEAAR